MWQIHLVTTTEGRSTLRCENILGNSPLAASNLDRPLITHLEIFKHTGPRATIVINVNQTIMSEKLFSKFKLVELTQKGISRLRQTDKNLSVKLQVNYEDSLVALKEIIQSLDQEIADFGPIRSNLPTIFAVEKQKIIDTMEQRQQEFVSSFERLIENTMTATMHASMRASEQSLRQNYGFPIPPPGTWPISVQEPNHIIFEDYEEEDDPEDQEEYEGEDEYDEEDNVAPGAISWFLTSAQPLNLQPNINYKQRESDLINELYQQLVNLETKYLRKGYLVQNNHSRWGVDMILSEKSISLIKAPASSVNQSEREAACQALNLIATIRAISFRGSHYTNTGMYHTQLQGYGMRNIVALMWNCCKKADSQNRFPTGVTIDDALLSLTQGISDGARGDNRNRDCYDDLLPDRPSCDQGKYNAMFNAMLGIFPEIVIIYDYTDMLLVSLKNEIIQNIVAFAEQKSQAEQILKIWIGTEKEESLPRYTVFRDQLLAKFPSMLTKFIEMHYSTAPETLRRKILEQIKEDIKKVENLSFGLKYIETVSPTQQLLDVEWHKRHPPRDEESRPTRKRLKMR